MKKFIFTLNLIVLCLHGINSKRLSFYDVFKTPPRNVSIFGSRPANATVTNRLHFQRVHLEIQVDYETKDDILEIRETVSSESTDLSDLELMPEILFERFIRKYDKNYLNDAEKSKRFSIFRKNLLNIKKYNSDPNDLAQYGINHLADHELSEITGLKIPAGYASTAKFLRFYGNVSALPDSFDWRKHGAVTPVKNQGHCGNFILVKNLDKKIIIFGYDNIRILLDVFSNWCHRRCLLPQA